MPGLHVHSAKRVHKKPDHKSPNQVNHEAVYASIENEEVIEVDEPSPVLMQRVTAVEPIAIKTAINPRHLMTHAEQKALGGLFRGKALSNEEEFDAARWKDRAHSKGIVRAGLAIFTLAQSFFWFDFSGLTVIVFLVFALSAAKWFALARDEAKLEAWWRQRHSTKGMRRFFTWLIAIPVSLATFLLIALQGL
jgi:hypothetical protein